MSEFNYYLEGDELWCEGVRLGPSDALFLDTRQTGLVRWLEKVQPEAGWPRLVTCQLPYGDYVFVSKNGVVAIESKTIPDLMGSYERRRLQRQLRHLLTAAPMAILGIVVDSITPEGVPSEILLDVAKWDMSLGSTILIPSRYSEGKERSALNATEEEWLKIPEVHMGIIKSRRRLIPCTNTAEVMGGQS
jgi:hypothetical protein